MVAPKGFITEFHLEFFNAQKSTLSKDEKRNDSRRKKECKNHELRAASCQVAVQLIFQEPRKFSNDLLASKDIDFDFQTSFTDDQQLLDPYTRRHVYLIFKESIHNLVRHSACTEAQISLNATSSELTPPVIFL